MLTSAPTSIPHPSHQLSLHHTSEQHIPFVPLSSHKHAQDRGNLLHCSCVGLSTRFELRPRRLLCRQSDKAASHQAPANAAVCRADAVAIVLFETELTWAGSLHRRKDTCAVKALAINAAGKKQPVLWASKRLPSDSFAVRAVPGGGVLVLSPSLVIYQNKVPRLPSWCLSRRRVCLS